MSAAPTFRLATAADVPALAALYACSARTLGPACYSPGQVAAWAGFGADTPAFRDYILGSRTWLTAAADGTPLGFCGVDDAGEVHSLYVQAGHTRRGLGTALLAQALADARGRGVQRFCAWATPFSRPLFERAGLVLVEEVLSPFGGELFRRLRLATPQAGGDAGSSSAEARR